MLPTDDDCDACTLKMPDHHLSTVAFASLPFIATFFLVGSLVLHKLFPLLSGGATHKEQHHSFPNPNYAFSKAASSSSTSSVARRLRLSVRRLAGVTFSTNIALSAVLAELILCEISNTFNPAARRAALRFTIPALLVLLILVAPALELHSIISSSGFQFAGVAKARRRIAWFLELVGLSIWLLGFWYLGKGPLGAYLKERSYTQLQNFREACLERIGIIGISLMASLAGFAAVSNAWQAFGVKPRNVTEADVSRKQAGLDATNEMLEVKRSRLRALERKLSEPSHEGFMTRVIGQIRGNADTQERSNLQLEISGLETMRLSLSNSLLSLQNRRAAQLKAHTPIGRMQNLFSFVFSIYCVYRLVNTAIQSARRVWSPAASFSSSDPVNNVLAILAKHWDPSLDREAWSHQISFLLSGIMLLLSINAVLQTFLLFSRFFPSLLQHAQQNLALLVSQVAATYVISSALLLRSNLPREVGSVIGDVVGRGLEASFVDRWFESWFLGAAACTAVGIWLGRKLKGGEWDEDELGEADVEMGKMS